MKRSGLNGSRMYWANCNLADELAKIQGTAQAFLDLNLWPLPVGAVNGPFFVSGVCFLGCDFSLDSSRASLPPI